MLIAAFAGLRWGELAALRRRDIDLEQRVVDVSRALVEVRGEITFGPPKSDAGVRKVAMPPVLVAELQAHLSTFVDEAPDALVLTGVKGGPLVRTNFTARWKKARKAIGRTDLHVHDLRHFANTLAASSGASTRELMARLGHSTSAAALRYKHATEERDRLIAERMDVLITGDREAEIQALRVRA